LADLSGAHLEGAKMGDAMLAGADLSDSTLQSADMEGADLSGASLNGARMEGARLMKTLMAGADLSGANMQSADFRKADLRGALIISAEMDGANFKGADLRGALILDSLPEHGQDSLDLGGAYTGEAPFGAGAREDYMNARLEAACLSEHSAKAILGQAGSLLSAGKKGRRSLSQSGLDSTELSSLDSGLKERMSKSCVGILDALKEK